MHIHIHIIHIHNIMYDYEGSVLEAFASAATADGYAVPAGTLKVRSAAGVKWILAEKAPDIIETL